MQRKSSIIPILVSDNNRGESLYPPSLSTPPSHFPSHSFISSPLSLPSIHISPPIVSALLQLPSYPPPLLPKSPFPPLPSTFPIHSHLFIPLSMPTFLPVASTPPSTQITFPYPSTPSLPSPSFQFILISPSPQSALLFCSTVAPSHLPNHPLLPQ